MLTREWKSTHREGAMNEDTNAGRSRCSVGCIGRGANAFRANEARWLGDTLSLKRNAAPGEVVKW